MSPTRLSQAQNSTINGPRPSPLRIAKDSIPIRKSSIQLDHQERLIRPQKNNPVIIYTQSPKIIHTQARDFMALVQKLTGFSRSKDKPNNIIITENNNSNNNIIGGPPRKIKINHPEAPPLIPGRGNNNIDIITSSNVNFVGENYYKVDEEVAIIGDNNGRKESSSPPSPSSSNLTKENSWGGDGDNNYTDHHHHHQISQVFSDSSNIDNHHYLADFPLFTPTSANLFCSPKPVERYPGSLHVSPGIGNPISPSFFEFIKGLPEY